MGIPSASQRRVSSISYLLYIANKIYTKYFSWGIYQYSAVEIYTLDNKTYLSNYEFGKDIKIC